MVAKRSTGDSHQVSDLHVPNIAGLCLAESWWLQHQQQQQIKKKPVMKFKTLMRNIFFCSIDEKLIH